MLFRSYDLQGSEAVYQNDLMLINFIRTPAGDGTIGDLIVNAFQKNEKEALNTALGGILQKVYGQAENVCWKLWYFDDSGKEQLAGIPCRKTEDIFKGDVIFLMPDGKQVKLELTVPGYAK